MANAMSSTTTYCTACSRCFVDRSAIEAHYRDSPAHVGLWCQRCERHFAQVADRNQHIENSNSHWVCARLSWTDRPCSFDGYSHKSLHNHWTESGHHKFCEECNLDYLTSAQLHQHGLEAHAISNQPPYVVPALCPPSTTPAQPKASNDQAHTSAPSAAPHATPSAAPHATPSSASHATHSAIPPVTTSAAPLVTTAAAPPALPATHLPSPFNPHTFMCSICKTLHHSVEHLRIHWLSVHNSSSVNCIEQREQPYAPSIVTSEPHALLTPEFIQAAQVEAPRREGTRHTLYEAMGFVNSDGNIDRYHSISAQPQYQSFSYEELRVADYRASSYFSSFSTASKIPWKSENGCTKENVFPNAQPKASSSSAALTNNFLPSTTLATGNKPPEASSSVPSLSAALANASIKDSPEIPPFEPAKVLVQETEKLNVECWASCSSSFPSLAAVLLHLESSACPGGTTTFDLHGAAANCEHWYEFIDGPYVRELRLGRDLGAKYSNNAYPFVCPKQECEKVFQKLSSLFAHVESGTCKGGQEVGEGAMKELKDALVYRVGNGLI